MYRRANIFFFDAEVGLLCETEDGFEFSYLDSYLDTPRYGPVSKTLPLQTAPFKSRTFIPFFDGLIPEGWLLSFAEKNWKLKETDRMGLLLACCQDTIGAVSVKNQTPNNQENRQY